MKKIILLLVVIVLTVPTFSQSGKGAFNNKVYTRIGYAFPGGDLKSEKVISSGALFEVGTLFYIHSLKLPEKLKLGIDATFLSFTGLINMSAYRDSNETVSYYTAGAKVGPVISYNFAKDWIADVYFKLHPNYFITGQKDIRYLADNQFRLGTSFGLNIRWKLLMLGCEFTSEKVDFDLITASPAMNPLTTETKSIKLPITNISLGVNF